MNFPDVGWNLVCMWSSIYPLKRSGRLASHSLLTPPHIGLSRATLPWSGQWSLAELNWTSTDHLHQRTACTGVYEIEDTIKYYQQYREFSCMSLYVLACCRSTDQLAYQLVEALDNSFSYCRYQSPHHHYYSAEQWLYSYSISLPMALEKQSFLFRAVRSSLTIFWGTWICLGAAIRFLKSPRSFLSGGDYSKLPKIAQDPTSWLFSQVVVNTPDVKVRTIKENTYQHISFRYHNFN